jgi:malic enzyme
LGHLEAKPTDLERYIYLIGLSDRNETLFYRTVMSDPARFIPILYDPTVAEACLTFGHIYRRARGMLLSSQANILETEVTTATRVAAFMFEEGLAQVERPRDLRAWVEGQLYRPHY